MTNNSLFAAMKACDNTTQTTNGMTACRSTLSALLDLFMGGASLRKTPEQVPQAVRAAYREDKLGTLRCLFYLRDIRGNGGQGERAVFRAGIRTVAELDTELFVRSGVIKQIPFYGRWDDVFCLLDVSRELDAAVFSLVAEQLKADCAALAEQGKKAQVSLLAKWLPSCNTSSATTRALAKRIYRTLRFSEKEYRQVLTALRRQIDVLETRLSRRDYTFRYSAVPSNAGLKYRKAFMRNDGERYKAYVESLHNVLCVQNCAVEDVKVNVGTLYPYDIMNKFRYGALDATECMQLDNMWRSLPDYFGEAAGANWLAVVDVSGSMTWGGIPYPIDVAMSLGLYVAERNTGIFKDKMITFSASPQLVEVDPAWPLKQKVEYMLDMDWGMNTNLEAVFRLVLDAAVQAALPAEQMPQCIIIISDMQFDSCVEGAGNPSAYEMIRQRFEAAGYAMPRLVFWNVAQRNYGNVPVRYDQQGTMLVGGCKPGMFEQLLSGKTPEDFMLSVLNSERYQPITLA
ncbi:MAG: DUF2828 family protein [Akkermansia sp.]|nr:DUF2828 family protein [Akkermansia sp.]